MSGIAIIINGADFSKLGLGSVHIKKEVPQKIKDRTAAIINDGGKLLYGDVSQTWYQIEQHTLLLNGIEPRLDFIGYKSDEMGKVTKLYSVDSIFDSTEVENIAIKGDRLSNNGEGFAKVKYAKTNDILLTSVYYESTDVKYVNSGGQMTNNYIWLNVLDHKTSNVTGCWIHNISAALNIQRNISTSSTSKFTFINSHTLLKTLYVKVSGDGNLEKVVANGEDITNTAITGDDYWQAGGLATAYFNLFKGTGLIVGA